jgi:hypothetical protein
MNLVGIFFAGMFISSANGPYINLLEVSILNWKAFERAVKEAYVCN